MLLQQPAYRTARHQRADQLESVSEFVAVFVNQCALLTRRAGQVIVPQQSVDHAAEGNDIVAEAFHVRVVVGCHLTVRKTDIVHLSCDLVGNPLPAGLARKTEGLTSTQSLLAHVAKHQQQQQQEHDQQRQQLQHQQRQQQCASDAETAAYAELWARADADCSGQLDVTKVQRFFSAAGQKEPDVAELVNMARANKYSLSLSRAEFDVMLGLLALKQQQKPLSVDAVRQPRTEPLIPHIGASDALAPLNLRTSPSPVESDSVTVSAPVRPAAVPIHAAPTTPMEHWSVDDLCAHFQQFGAVEKHFALLRDELVDGDTLQMLSSDELNKNLAMPLGVVKKHERWLQAQHGPSMLTRQPVQVHTLEAALADLLPTEHANVCLELVRQQKLAPTLAVLQEQRQLRTQFWCDISATYPALAEL